MGFAYLLERGKGRWRPWIAPEANQLEKRYYDVFARFQDYLDYAFEGLCAREGSAELMVFSHAELSSN